MVQSKKHWRSILPGLFVLLAAQLSVLVGDVDVELQGNTRAVKHGGVGPLMVIAGIQSRQQALRHALVQAELVTLTAQSAAGSMTGLEIALV